MTYTSRIEQRLKNLKYVHPKPELLLGFNVKIWTFNDHVLSLYFKVQNSTLTEAFWRQTNGENSLWIVLVDVMLELSLKRPLKELTLLSSREIENYLRDHNDKMAILDEKLLEELDKLLEYVKNSVYNLGQNEIDGAFKKLSPGEFQSFSLVKKMGLLEQVLDFKVRPTLYTDQGNIELVDLDENSVIVSFKGACDTCPSSETGTLDFIQQTLREELSVPELNVVIE